MSNDKKNLFLASRDKRSKRLLDKLTSKYNVVATYNENITAKDKLLMFLMAGKYFYPDYRKYRHISKCCPYSIDYRAKKTENYLNSLDTKIDFIFQFGATYPPIYTKPPLIPYFVYTDSCCDPDDKTYPWRWRAPRVARDYANKQLEVFTNATKIFTHSQWAKDTIIKVHGIDENKIIPVGSGPILDPIDERVNFQEKENIVLFVGGDFHRKGVDILRNSVDKVANEIPDVKFVIIGKNTDKMKFKDHPNFELLGPIFDKSLLAQYYRKAKVFVLPSRFEPLGHVLWEAMSFSTPVIVAQAGGMPETVIEGYNGFTFPVENHEILADNIIKILNDNELANKLSYNAKSHYDEKGHWEGVAQRISEELDKSI
ncbi:MAG: glycosyltransferase family 4 protein [Vampirovibrionia bacterium]